MTTLKIDNADFILTLNPSRHIIRNGSILINQGNIVQIGKTLDLKYVLAEKVINAEGMIVTPGFINGHAHLSYAHATRGIFPDNLPNLDYLRSVFALQSIMTEEEEYYTSLLAITELIKYGTTCFFDPGTTKFLEACMSAYQMSGCRILLGRQVVDQPNPINIPPISTQNGLKHIEETIRRYDHHLNDKVRVWATPFSSEFCSEELLRGSKKIADEYGTGLTLHQSNRPRTIQHHLTKFGERPVEYLKHIGLLGSNVLLAHVTGLNSKEIDCISQSDTKTVMCPSASLKSGSGTLANGMLPEMLKKNICVALGTDSANNSNLLEIFKAMYLVSVIYKDARENVDIIPPETSVEMATIRGAQALGLEKQIGSIEIGKKADLVLLDTMRPEMRTIFNPINNIVYNADGRCVHTVIINGNPVVENHSPLFVDEIKLINKMQTIGENLLARAKLSIKPRWPFI